MRLRRFAAQAAGSFKGFGWVWLSSFPLLFLLRHPTRSVAPGPGGTVARSGYEHQNWMPTMMDDLMAAKHANLLCSFGD